MKTIKCYSELIEHQTFEDRFNYLKIDSYVGNSSFGFARYVNQQLYKSREWSLIKNQVILRDQACDMALEEYPLYGKRNAVVHHINPITIEMIQQSHEFVFDLEYLVCVSFNTHNQIHFGNIDGNELNKRRTIVERVPNDTCPWR